MCIRHHNKGILQNRWRYGHPGGLFHVGIHAIGSFSAFLIINAPLNGILFGLLAVEAVLHYHIDWAKDNVSRRLDLTQNDRIYWKLMGLDQFLHHVTYVGMVAFWFGVTN